MMARNLLRRAPVGLVLLTVTLGGPFFAHANAPPGRYTLGTQIVTDTVTKLKWQRTIVPGMSFGQATTFCAGSTFEGIAGGWRLPNARELVTLLDVRAPTATRALDVAFYGADHSLYLRSSSIAPSGAGSYVMAIDMGNQQVFRTSAPASLLAVLCVHE